MVRYIDADAFDKYIQNKWDENEISNGEWILFREMLNEQPTADVVEVVRCKDCMFNHWHTTPHGNKVHFCNLNQLIFSEHADFYCAYGERK